MRENTSPRLTGYDFQFCNHKCARASHEIGYVEQSENVLAIWALRTNNIDTRSKLLDELQGALSSRVPTAVLLSSLNDVLLQDDPSGSKNFAELGVMVLDGSDHTLEITAAGAFLPEFLLTPDGIVEFDNFDGSPPLGILPSIEIEFDTQVVELAPEASVIWISPYTTQIVSGGEMYQRHRVLERIRAVPNEPRSVVESIRNDIRSFIDDRDQNEDEDICIICFKRTD